MGMTHGELARTSTETSSHDGWITTRLDFLVNWARAGSLCFGELLGLVKGMHAGRIRLALIKGDPRHGIPPATGFQQALDNVPFTVSFSMPAKRPIP